MAAQRPLRRRLALLHSSQAPNKQGTELSEVLIPIRPQRQLEHKRDPRLYPNARQVLCSSASSGH